MFDWYNFLHIVLQVFVVSTLVAVCMVFYRTLGRPTKPFTVHHNPYFRFFAAGISNAVIVLPLLRHVSVYPVFTFALLTNIVLQKIADDYL